jgi:LAS superfamily LD-carboxypeptidase LdcB
MANPILESLLAPYQRAIKGTPTTRGSIADDPLLSLLLPQLQAQGQGGRGGGGAPVADHHGEGLHPLLARLQSRLPWLDITSGYRTEAQQAALYAQKPGLAAPPGHSYHETGKALDVHSEDIDRLVRWLSKHPRYGNRIYRPMDYEPWHFQLEGPR